MRLLVFFDLPMLTDKNRREYNRFHKFLLKNGFIMMQKSVYTKLVINNVTSSAVKQRVRNNLPPEGVVELLEITENQFSKIEYLVGEEQQLVIDSLDRLVEI
ncbi:MAG: CRISPR-associated endonuclease Cas2 [Clostridiales bacterium]|nr:CRISPR-associated endonuclease Cas2 [Clostridiales bacterium]